MRRVRELFAGPARPCALRLWNRRCRLPHKVRARHGRTRREGPGNPPIPGCRVQDVAGFGRLARDEDRLIAPRRTIMPRRSVLHRAFAALAVMGFLVAVLAQSVSAQINPPVPAPTGPVNPAIPAAATPFASPSPSAESSPAAQTFPEVSPAAAPLATPAPGASATPAAGESATPAAGESATPAPGETAPGEASPSPSPTPTQPPIVVIPATPAIEPG